MRMVTWVSAAPSPGYGGGPFLPSASFPDPHRFHSHRGRAAPPDPPSEEDEDPHPMGRRKRIRRLVEEEEEEEED